MAGVDPDSPVAQAWAELLQARQLDPSSADVAARAHALLADDPPVGGRLAAWAALAEQAYRIGDDPGAARWAETGLSQIASTDISSNADARAAHADLSTTRVQALARGGDPAAALAALADSATGAALSDDIRLGARAVALDRNADGPAAVVAYLQWREALSDDDAAAAWAERRAKVLADTLTLATLGEALDALPPGSARECLAARVSSSTPSSDQPPWVQRCTSDVQKIGIMLPRTGPLSALADEQLAAASAATEILAPKLRGVQIVWEDPGSTPSGAAKAVRRLKALDVDVIVGPIGPPLIAAAAKEAGETLPLVVPGEGRGSARGVAPSLEARVNALVGLAKKQKRVRLVVLAPDNSYGARAVAAAKAKAQGMKHAIVVRTYPSNTTSFAGTLKPITTALSDGSAVLVADHLSRAEMVVRQLARLGKVPTQTRDSGLLVMTTAEGASQRGLDKAGAVFEGVWAAPAASVASAGGAGRRFARAYARAVDDLPSDQGMLVYFAMHMAMTGRAAKGSGQAPLVRVVEGEFVSGSAASAK